jgi:hypothetical protein
VLELEEFEESIITHTSQIRGKKQVSWFGNMFLPL